MNLSRLAPRVLTAAAVVLVVAAGTAGCTEDPARPADAAAATRTPSPTPTRPAYTEVTYTTANGVQVPVRSDQPLPKSVRQDVIAAYQTSAATAKAGTPGQYTQAANALNAGADTIAERTGRPTAFFFPLGGGTDGRVIYVT